MKKHNLIEMEILFVLATEQPAAQQPPEEGWYLSSLYRKIRLEFQQIIIKTKEELASRGTLHTPDLKFRFSKSQVEKALNTLNDYGLIEIRKDTIQESEEVSLTFWGLIQVLYNIFQRHPVNNKKLEYLLRELAERNTGKLRLLFQEWNKLDPQLRKNFVEKMREYFRADQLKEPMVELLNKKTHVLKDRKSKEIISRIAYNDFFNFVFLEQNHYPLDYELIHLREKLLKRPAELLNERAKMLSLIQHLREKREEFKSNTKCSPLFSRNINNFMHNSIKNSYSLNWIANINLKKTIREGYQTWVSLSLILLLKPTQFKTKNVNSSEVETIAFFKGKNDIYDPNFAFYSDKVTAWIKFAFGAVFAYPKYKYPNIWISSASKRENFFTFDNLSNLILLESKEETGWVNRSLWRNYVNSFKHSTLFVVCWENENFDEVRDSRIEIIKNAYFDEVKLLPIIGALKANVV